MQPYLPYLLLLGAVVFVGAMVMPRKKQNVMLPDQTVQNMENALEQFMENMEKDNQELVQLVTNAQQAAKKDADHKEKRIVELERICESLTEQLKLTNERPVVQLLSETPKKQLTEAVIMEPVSIPTIHARYSELFLLYDQGKSIESISKKLGMNKGEVQLIIQLAKQEAAAHA
ncbi:hypothetical protein L1N85_01135 [Paenibacillus alkaliterrae]|uniref:DUF6115 domain-containing protein n=1 Tax=Paenibacillus alkaliterrae TaxID=320909 RepID=UPI001F2CC970|nr:hypothetical protein [Paenibacillus alkaliterrae]MCF2937034.1 hypothetical protein [Paenibacillus alkaliterrae]